MSLSSRLATVAVLVVVTACGSHGHGPLSAGVDPAGRPSWGGCQQRSTSFLDYAVGAKGPRTPRAAVASYRTSGDRLLVRGDGTRRRVLLVDGANVIHAALVLLRGSPGWLVSSVSRCSD